jgi:transcriptional regulator GlxA family with amidase domain
MLPGMTSLPTAIVAFDGVQSLDVTGPWEVLHTADLYAGSSRQLLLATPEGRTVRSESGIQLTADASLASIERVDTLIVAGGDGTRTAVGDASLIAEIARLAAGARRTASVCSGAFLLAEAGLLDGRRATTHWSRCESLARRYPEVTVEPDAIFVRDGSILTSAGVTAGMDLALALVEDDLGRDVALQTARQLVVYARRPGGQSQFSVQLSQQLAEREPVRDLQAWMADHLDEDLSVGTLAGRMHLSERQLTRVFGSELGASPADYVERLRVERARSMLETDGASLESVASRCGFASAEVMRRAFHRRLGASPSDYRRRFRIPTAV